MSVRYPHNEGDSRLHIGSVGGVYATWYSSLSTVKCISLNDCVTLRTPKMVKEQGPNKRQEDTSPG
jgi:hypothetical protein